MTAIPGVPGTGSIAEQVADELMRRLLRTPIPVKLPAYLGCTLRSEPVEWSLEHISNGAGNGVNRARVAVTWDPLVSLGFTTNPLTSGFIEADEAGTGNIPAIPPPFPSGLVGVVWPMVQVAQINTDTAADQFRAARFSIFKNGAFVNGLTRQTAGGALTQMPTANAPKGQLQAGFFTTRCPILLREGNTMEVEAFADDLQVGTSLRFLFRISGYRFPAVDSGPSLMAMIAD